MQLIDYKNIKIHKWSCGASTFRAWPEVGARLMDWEVSMAGAPPRPVIHWPDQPDLSKPAKIRGGNPILFPFVARTFDQGQIGYWRAPDGQRRPMPMHGFARQGKFQVTQIPARGFDAVLVPDEEAKVAYPFNYEFTVAYRFAPLGLSCECTLKNFDTRPIPWSAGHHFYFTVPWSEGLARSDYAIRIPATRTLRQDAATGRLVAGPAIKPEEPLNNETLVDTLHLGLKNNTVVFGKPGMPGQVDVRNGTAAVPHPEATFVTWAPDADTPYYCVEPWMGPPNAPETKVGLHWVQPGQTQSFVVEVAVK